MLAQNFWKIDKLNYAKIYCQSLKNNMKKCLILNYDIKSNKKL